MNILLLGGGLQALCCGAALSNYNYEVDVVSDKLQIKRSSFFSTVYKETCKTKEQLYKILKRKHYAVIIPMGDVNATFLSKNKVEIETIFGCKCAIADYQVLSIVEDKHLFMKFCEEYNIPHPKTCVLNKDTINRCVEEIGFPALIKPDFSVGARGITLVNSQSELLNTYQNVIDKYGACTLQELIENKEYYYNVMLYRNVKGEFLAYTVIKIVRMYPINAGSSSCCVSVKNEVLLQVCKNCLDKLNWVGFADFDVLHKQECDEYKIIEINARVPASLKGSLISGVNFPYIIVQDILGRDVPHYKYKYGKFLRYLGLDLMWFIKSNKRMKSKPNWFNFFGKDIFYQDIYKKDLSTWWSWLVEGYMKLKQRNKKIR